METSKSSKTMRAPEIGNINLHIVKASATITLSSIVDVKSVWRYYKLQVSTLSKPNKPTKNPPEGWTTTEPSYTNGSTNNLYFCDLTVFSDDTFVYSDVSLSSSYEAAKAAYNKAIAADNKVDNMEIGGRNLARNTSNEWSEWVTPKYNSTNSTASSGSVIYFPSEINVGDEFYMQCEVEFDNVTPSDGKRSYFALQGSVDGKWEANKFNPWNKGIYDIKNGVLKISYKKTSNVKPTPPEVYADCAFRVDDWATGRYRWRRIKVEFGNKATDWSPAPEDLVSESKTYTDAQLKITSDSITSTVSKTYATKTEVTEDVNKNKSEIISMGEQLVINGSGLMGDNTNFSSLTFDASKSNGSAGSFTRTGSTNSSEYSDMFFPVSPNIRYSFELDAMSSKEKAAMFSFLDFYDVDKKRITSSDHMYIPNTLTTLAKDLKNGDTVVYLTDMTNWLTSGGNVIYTRGFIFWNYKNSFGYTYPEHTYSKNHYYDLYTDSGINTIAKTITLKKPWTYGTFPAGTKVSQSNSGNTFKYQAMSYTIPPSIWKHYSGYYDGTDYSGQNVGDKFPPGAAYAKVGFLWNYNKSDDQVWVTNISVKTDYKHAIDEVATRVTNAETKIEQNSEAITLRATKTEVTDAVDTGVQTSKTYTDTELTQTSEEIRFDFNKSITSSSSELQSRIDDNDVATNQKLSEINKYIRFVDGKIILGETGNELMLTIQNNRVSFTQSGVEVAYFSENKLHINKAEVLTSMKIGNYELAPRNDGGLALRKWRQ